MPPALEADALTARPPVPCSPECEAVTCHPFPLPTHLPAASSSQPASPNSGPCAPQQGPPRCRVAPGTRTHPCTRARWFQARETLPVFSSRPGPAKAKHSLPTDPLKARNRRSATVGLPTVAELRQQRQQRRSV